MSEITPRQQELLDAETLEETKRIALEVESHLQAQIDSQKELIKYLDGLNRSTKLSWFMFGFAVCTLVGLFS